MTIDVRTEPDPPTTGNNRFDLTVQAPNGSPVADADVTVTYFMVDMTSMRHEVKRERSADGKYTGSGDIEMTGKWEATISARRDGQEIGTRKIVIEAK